MLLHYESLQVCSVPPFLSLIHPSLVTPQRQWWKNFSDWGSLQKLCPPFTYSLWSFQNSYRLGESMPGCIKAVLVANGDLTPTCLPSLCATSTTQKQEQLDSYTNCCRLTESTWRKAQMFHPCPHQRIEFLPLWAPEKSQSLLADPLCRTAGSPFGPAGTPTPLPAQPPCPLHALPPQQRVVWRVRRGGNGLRGCRVPVDAGPG